MSTPILPRSRRTPPASSAGCCPTVGASTPSSATPGSWPCHGIRAFSLHPGAILTNLGRHLTEADVAALLEPDADGNVVVPELKTPEQGADTAVWAATSPLLATRGGEFCEDPDAAARLWAWSAGMIGCDVDAG